RSRRVRGSDGGSPARGRVTTRVPAGTRALSPRGRAGVCSGRGVAPGMSENSVESVKTRREPRFTVGWTVRVQTKGVDEVHTLQTMNLSRSGAFICTPHQVPAGTLL